MQPGARRSEWSGRHGDALKVRIAAPATEGRANRTLIAFLAGQFGVPKRRVVIEHGLHGRDKRVRVIAPAVLPGDLFP